MPVVAPAKSSVPLTVASAPTSNASIRRRSRARVVDSFARRRSTRSRRSVASRYEELSRGAQLNTTEIANRICYPTQTTRRALEELAGHGVALRESGGRGKADRWQLADWAAKNLSRNVGKDP
jgi:hypothetical protein